MLTLASQALSLGLSLDALIIASKFDGLTPETQKEIETLLERECEASKERSFVSPILADYYNGKEKEDSGL